jgi:putative membrane protein
MFVSLAAASVASHAMGPWAGGGFAFGWLFLLIPLFWIGVIVLIATTVGRRWRRAAAYRGYGPGFGPGFAHGGTRAAEQTLAERFAQGDIDEVEYRARLEVLRANRGGEA